MADWEDYYEILGVSPDSTTEKVKETYRYKVNILHPDRLMGAPESVRRRAEEDLKRVNQAYEVLRDPQKRQEYHSEWVKQRTKAKETFIPEPKPTVDPPHIRFSNVEPGEIKRASFIIRNVGGPYSKIWFSNPDSWVRVVRWASLSRSDELPLEIEIEAEGEDWGKSYLEYIRVKLDEEETQVRIELRTKPEPAREKVAVTGIPKTRPTPSPPPPPVSPRRGFPTWGKWFIGLAVLGLMGILIGQFWPSDTHTSSSTNKPATPVVQPMLSGTIIFVSKQDANEEIYAMDASGVNQINLTNHTADDWDPAPSPDGNRIAFVSDRDGNPEIYVMNSDGSGVVRLTSNDVDDMNPAWFPDGLRIVFARNVNNGKGYILDPRGNWEHRIFLMDADGSNQRRLEMDPEVVKKDYPVREYNNNQPTVSPDGQRIAFTVESYWSGHPPVIYVMDSDGTNLSRLCGKFLHEGGNSEHYQMPRWSPDGNQIVFFSDSKQIYIMNLQQMTKKMITSGEQASWSPDGTKIAFCLRRGEDYEIYVSNSDGTNRVQLTYNAATDISPVWSIRTAPAAASSSSDNDPPVSSIYRWDGTTYVSAEAGVVGGNDEGQQWVGSDFTVYLYGLDHDGTLVAYEYATYDNTKNETVTHRVRELKEPGKTGAVVPLHITVGPGKDFPSRGENAMTLYVRFQDDDGAWSEWAVAVYHVSY